MNISNEWTTEVPQEVGHYFFYGDIYRDLEDPNFKAQLQYLQVFEGSNELIYILEGQFFFPDTKEPWHGKFKKLHIDFPEL